MQIPSTGREYATWTITGADTDTALAVSFDGGEEWHDLERPDDTTARILVAGPAAEGSQAGAVVLRFGRNAATIRAADTPEIVVRAGGHVDVGP